MKTFYKKFTALAIMVVTLLVVNNVSFAQNVNKKDVWKYSHFTSEAEYIQHLNGTRYGGNFTETPAPTGNVRFPAEFEPMQGVIISYVSRTTGFGLPSEDMIADMTKSCKVYVLVSSSNQARAEIVLEDAGANMNNVVFWNMDVDSYWARDFGPWYIFNDNEPAIVDFVYNRNRANDDDAPINIANNYQQLPLYGMNLTHTGGNMMQDGRGTGVSDLLVVNENTNEATVRQKMNDYLNIDPYHITIDPLGQYIAHVDCWGKFLAPDKIIIARMPQNDAHYQDYESVAQYFATTNCCYGYPYKVYRVDELSSADNGTLAPYTNSLILNDKVYVPLGSNNTYNNNAIAVYQEAMPGYEIIGVNSPSKNPWLNSDAIHCRARGMMDFDMMFVDHRNVIYGDEVGYQSNYTVNADLIAYSGANITTANLVYRVNDGAWTTVSMSHTTGNTYTANIPGVYGAEIDYYVTATDAEGNTGSQPIMGALDPHSFSIEENPLGIIDFEVSSQTVTLNEYVAFTNLTTIPFSDDFCQWTLEGADPEITGATEPTVQYHTPGTYDVTFAILDEDGNVLYSLTKQDYITVVNAYKMQNGSVYACNTTFYDDGGADGDYSASQNKVFTIYPCGEGRSRIQVQFDSFTTESKYDVLKVYDGTVANTSILIGSYQGSNVPGTITATNPDGALTFKFTSDRAVCMAGWEASVTCITPDYQVAVAACENGSIATDLQEAFENETITVVVTPDEGYNLESVYYVDADNNRTDIDLHSLSFAMPAKNVTVHATFSTMATQHDILMGNGSSIADNVVFYDHGGADANYSNKENYTYTFTPAVEGGFVQIDFVEFDTESKYDKLTVSDGNGRIAALNGTNLPSRIISSTGSLTFQFKSDNSITRPGWKALVTTFVYEQYDITLNEPVGGTIAVDKTAAFAGETVTLTATPNTDYFFVSWNVTCNSETVQVTNNQFIMPEGDVMVSARFAQGYYTPARYELVTNANDLEAGCRIIIANANTGSAYAMGEQKITSTSYGGGVKIYNYFREAVGVNIIDGEGDETGQHYIEEFDGAVEFILEGSTGNWSFYDEEEYGYLYCYRYKNINNNYIYGLNTISSSSYKNWGFTFYADGLVRVRNTMYMEDMGYGSNKFDVFASTNGKKLYLFKKVEGYWTEGTAPSRKGAIAAADENESEIVNVISTNIYPNPTSGNLTIEAEGMNHISVFNLMGQMVYDMDVNTDNMNLDMNQFNAAGMYVIRLNTVNGVVTERVMVK